MPKSYHSTVLAVLMLAGLAGCTGETPESTPSAPVTSSATPPPVSAAPSPAAPSASPPAPPTATSSAAPPAAAAFPLAISRRGGFAGVEDRAEIAANGTVTVTSRGRPAARTTLPAATVAELSRLVTSTEFTGQAGRPEAPTCNDGYEYEVAGPAWTVTVHDCGQPHGAPIDRVLAIVVPLL
ncbi:hypothetical protein, partial [Actinoplanes philippinensis]|uniref:hypothetical protein n=1 Tax=Actinoplanes philippinensis TaxID=35752 RepID=UPI0033DDC8D3